jgi:hypothetical protein
MRNPERGSSLEIVGSNPIPGTFGKIVNENESDF